ncbi:hypothetical protein Tco_1314809 [Tanacetum coccineum]
MTDYALWEVIKNGNKVLKRTVRETKQEYEPTTDQVQRQWMNVGNQNGLIVVLGIDNQNPNGNGNVVAARAEGNANGNNDNPDKGIQDAAYLQKQMQIALKEEAGIQLTQEEFDFMADADAYEEIERTDQRSVEQGGGTVEQHSANVEETCAYHESLFHNLAAEVKKQNSLKNKIKFAKQSILGKPPSSSRPKLYAITPLPNSTAFPKVGEMNALSNPVTSNSVPSSRESTIVNNERVIAPGIFRINPLKLPRGINPFKASRYVNVMKSRKKNQSANVSKSANQKKHKANVKKSKKSGSKESLASPRPSKPRTCLRWLPAGRIFDVCRKITASSNTKSESDTSVCDNASASNPQEPANKWFPSSTSFLGRFLKLWRQNSCIYPLAIF